VLEALAAAAVSWAKARASAIATDFARRNLKPALTVLAAMVVLIVLLVSQLGKDHIAGQFALTSAAQKARPGAACTTTGQQTAVAMSTAVPAQYAALITRASTSCSGALPAPMMAAQIWAESHFNPSAGSPVGARGLVQFMPATWASHGIDGDGDGRADITNPVDNAMSAAKYICDLRRQIEAMPNLAGDKTDLTLAAYNAGLGNVRKYGGIPPFAETRSYIAKIRKQAAVYAGATGIGQYVSDAVDTCTAVTDVVATGGFTMPLRGGSYRLSSGFGPRSSPGGVGSTNHMGTDLAAPIGTPIFAVTAGTVLRAGAASGYGQAVYIQSGSLIIRYGHVSAFHTTAGAKVAAGQLIADVGNEGHSTGPHLHLECRPNDVPTDCVPFLRQRGVIL
jgi:murein DD-endopeptidase MepM/ murein hydrolase activator NlpD